MRKMFLLLGRLWGSGWLEFNVCIFKRTVGGAQIRSIVFEELYQVRYPSIMWSLQGATSGWERELLVLFGEASWLQWPALWWFNRRDRRGLSGSRSRCVQISWSFRSTAKTLENCQAFASGIYLSVKRMRPCSHCEQAQPQPQPQLCRIEDWESEQDAGSRMFCWALIKAAFVL